MNIKGFAFGIGTFGSCPDRFCTDGYKNNLSIEETIDKISSLKEVAGVMINYPTSLNENNASNLKKMIDDKGLIVSSCDADIYTQAEFALGSLTSENETVRNKAIDLCKRAMDMAEYMNADTMNLWPGQDGFDYTFQTDYYQQWQLLIDAVNKIGNHNPRIKLCLEYKLREPRTHLIINNAGVALHLAQMSGLPNVGVTIDLGHSFNCKESPGNTVAMLDLYKKLFMVHLNDNYRDWDDDMVVGTVHFWETLEFFYYLDRSNYQGWFNLDIYPYRENPLIACQTSVDNINFILKIVNKIDSFKTLKTYQKEADALSAFRYIKSLI